VELEDEDEGEGHLVELELDGGQGVGVELELDGQGGVELELDGQGGVELELDGQGGVDELEEHFGVEEELEQLGVDELEQLAEEEELQHFFFVRVANQIPAATAKTTMRASRTSINQPIMRAWAAGPVIPALMPAVSEPTLADAESKIDGSPGNHSASDGSLIVNRGSVSDIRSFSIFRSFSLCSLLPHAPSPIFNPLPPALADTRPAAPPPPPHRKRPLSVPIPYAHPSRNRAFHITSKTFPSERGAWR
jgi:hypothetical protein